MGTVYIFVLGGCGFESTHLFLGSGESFFLNLVLFRWFHFDWILDYFKGDFLIFSVLWWKFIMLTFTHAFTQFFCTVSKCKCFFVFGRFRWPLKGPSFVRLVWANPLILADSDSAGWTGWEVLTVHDEWKMALVMVLVQGVRVKMAVVCPIIYTEVHWE